MSFSNRLQYYRRIFSAYLVPVDLLARNAATEGFAESLACFHADFLAGATLENGNSHVLMQSILRFFKFLPGGSKKDVPGLCDRGVS